MNIQIKMGPVDEVSDATHVLILTVDSDILTQYTMYELHRNRAHDHYLIDNWGEVYPLDWLTSGFQFMRCQIQF